MTDKNKPSPPRPVQIDANPQPTSIWIVYDPSSVPSVPVGSLEADHFEAALALAQEQWTDHRPPVGVICASHFARAQTRFDRKANRAVKSVAFNEAAQAVISHRLGYHVESITTRAQLSAFDLSAGTCSHRLGFTRVSGFLSEEELSRPEHRAQAEDYVISLLAGPYVVALSRRQRGRWATPEAMGPVRTLIDRHANGCLKQYRAWIEQRTELTVYSAALLDIVALATALVRRRQMNRSEFLRALDRRMADSQRLRAFRAWQRLSAVDRRRRRLWNGPPRKPMNPFFEIEFEGQTLDCHHGGYVDASRLAEIAQADFEDFLASPEGQTRLEMIAYCVENEPDLIREYRSSARVHRLGSDETQERSVFWVHHTVAAEFLAWCRASALCDWFQEKRCELCWTEGVRSMWDAVATKVENEIVRLKGVDQPAHSHVVDLRNHLEELLRQIEAERVEHLTEVDVAFPLGQISFELTVEIAKVFTEKAKILDA